MATARGSSALRAGFTCAAAFVSSSLHSAVGTLSGPKIRADVEINRTYQVIAGVVSDKASSLAARTPLTHGEAVKRLRELYWDKRRKGGFDWGQMGLDASVYFREPPMVLGVYHLHGMFDAIVVKAPPKKAAQKREKVNFDDVGQLAKPEVVTDDQRAEALAAFRHTSMRNELLSQRSKLSRLVKCKDGDVAVTRRLMPLTQVVFDPWSYTHTVENLFYLSFLVKQGFVGMYFGSEVDEEGHAVVDEDGNDVNNKVPWLAVFNEIEFKQHQAGEDTTIVHTLSTPTASAASSSAKKQAGRGAQFVFEIDFDSYDAILDASKLAGQAPLLRHRVMHDCTCPPGTVHFDDSKALQRSMHKAADAEEHAAGSKRRRGAASSSSSAGGGVSESKGDDDDKPEVAADDGDEEEEEAGRKPKKGGNGRK